MPHRDATFIERLLGSKFGTFLTSAIVLVCIAIAVWMQVSDIAEVAVRPQRPVQPRQAPVPVAPQPSAPVVEAKPEPKPSPSPTPSPYKEPDPEEVIRKMKKRVSELSQ